MVSYGIDIGTTTLRAVAVEIQIGSFGRRSYKTIGNALCTFTPFTPGRTLDTASIIESLDRWVKASMLPPPEIGTLLFTGEAQRASNSVALGEFLTEKWNGLLSAQLNPELESRIAAYGSGAVELSAGQLGKTVIHIDIGGGTSNFARIENGEITDTACLNLGCRMWILDPQTHNASYMTKEGKYLAELINCTDPRLACDTMVDLLLAYAQGRVLEAVEPLIVVPWKKIHKKTDGLILSVSGGVVECQGETDPYRFSDLGIFFLQSLTQKAKNIRFSTQQGKATALGVSAFGFQVSGGSIYKTVGFRDSVKNVPLYDEFAFLERSEWPTVFAIATHFEETHSDKIESYAKTWRKRFVERNIQGRSVVFLFPKNIAKTFGYFFSRGEGEQPMVLALDEIQPEECRMQVRTLDLSHVAEGDRYLVTLKALHLF